MLDEPVLLAPGGFEGLRRALAELTPEQLLDEVKAANLRGRGGAGLPGRQSGSSRAKANDPDQRIVVNGDEGDPGSYIDKQLMERNPELLLEGMALAGYAVGARQGFVFVRSEYPRSPPLLREAVERARAAGHLGDDIHGSGFSFDVEVVEGAGSYVVGEETALLASLQGLRGTVSGAPAVPGRARLARQADRRQQRRDALQRPAPSRCTAPRPTRSSAPARRRAPSSSASTSASGAPACTRSASARRCARSARSSAAG